MTKVSKNLVNVLSKHTELSTVVFSDVTGLYQRVINAMNEASNKIESLKEENKKLKEEIILIKQFK